MAKAGKTTESVGLTFAELRTLLGKPISDPAFVAAMKRAGKVVVKPDFVIAKEAGFDFSLARPKGAKRNAPKLASTLFMFSEGSEKHRAFGDLPFGLAFTTRDDVLARLPAPKSTWKIGEGDVPVTTPDADHDSWLIEGVEISAHYRDGAVRVVLATCSS